MHRKRAIAYTYTRTHIQIYIHTHAHTLTTTTTATTTPLLQSYGAAVTLLGFIFLALANHPAHHIVAMKDTGEPV